MKTKTMVLCAIFAAMLCVFAVITIPIGPVPITLATFAIMLTAIILGPKNGTISVLVYLLLGTVGLPVFSGFRAGFQVFLGPTGGYAWSYIIMALIIGFISAKLPKNKYLAMLKIFIACLIGILVNYAAGTVQFMFVQQSKLIPALMQCVIPFVPLDIIKAVAASYLGYTVSMRLNK